MIPRLHLFELNDSAWVPVALRETIVEALGRTLSLGRILRGLADPFAGFLERTGATEVLDLCAGTGAPASILVRELKRAKITPPKFLLTDLHPHPNAWIELTHEHPGIIDFVGAPVDAAHIPTDIGRGRARVIINALHHFTPEVAGAILRGAAKSAPGIFIAEGFERRPLRFASYALAGVPSLYATPLLSHQRKLKKAMLTYLSPIALGAAMWDGFVSTLRVYTESELREMVAPIADMEWTYGTWDFFPNGRGYYFYGASSKRSAPPSP
jgi:hypothetical protein